MATINYGICKHDPDKVCTSKCEYSERTNEFHFCGKIDYPQFEQYELEKTFLS